MTCENCYLEIIYESGYDRHPNCVVAGLCAECVEKGCKLVLHSDDGKTYELVPRDEDGNEP